MKQQQVSLPKISPRQQDKIEQQIESLRAFKGIFLEAACVKALERKSNQRVSETRFIAQRFVNSEETRLLEQQKQKQLQPNAAMDPIIEVNFPKNLPLSSRNSDLYSIRQTMRKQLFDHQHFKPELETYRQRALFKDVYQPNRSLQNPEKYLFKEVQKFLKDSGSHRNPSHLISAQFDKTPKKKKESSKNVLQTSPHLANLIKDNSFAQIEGNLNQRIAYMVTSNVPSNPSRDNYCEEIVNTKFKPKRFVNNIAKLEANKLPSVFSEEFLQNQPTQISSILRNLHQNQSVKKINKIKTDLSIQQLDVGKLDEDLIAVDIDRFNVNESPIAKNFHEDNFRMEGEVIFGDMNSSVNLQDSVEGSTRFLTSKAKQHNSSFQLILNRNRLAVKKNKQSPGKISAQKNESKDFGLTNNPSSSQILTKEIMNKCLDSLTDKKNSSRVILHQQSVSKAQTDMILEELQENYENYTEQFVTDPWEREQALKHNKKFNAKIQSFEFIKSQKDRQKKFNEEYFTSPEIIKDAKDIKPSLAQIIIRDARQGVSNVWKPEKLRLNRSTQMIIEHNKQDV